MRRNRFPPGWGEERVQEDLYQSVAVLLNEGKETLPLAGNAGFRCCTEIESFKAYLAKGVLGRS